MVHAEPHHARHGVGADRQVVRLQSQVRQEHEGCEPNAIGHPAVEARRKSSDDHLDIFGVVRKWILKFEWCCHFRESRSGKHLQTISGTSVFSGFCSFLPVAVTNGIRTLDHEVHCACESWTCCTVIRIDRFCSRLTFNFEWETYQLIR